MIGHKAYRSMEVRKIDQNALKGTEGEKRRPSSRYGTSIYIVVECI